MKKNDPSNLSFIYRKRNNKSVFNFRKIKKIKEYKKNLKSTRKINERIEEYAKREGVQLDIGAFPRKRNITHFKEHAEHRQVTKIDRRCSICSV